jgi:two-component system response regulator YesN
LFREEANSRLALALTMSGGFLRLDDVARSRGAALSADQYFTTLILHNESGISPDSDELLRGLFAHISRCLATYHMQELHTMKRDACVILHLYGEKKPDVRTLSDICGQIRDYLLSCGQSRFHLILGETQRGCEQVYRSYNSAVLLLQSSFFSPWQSICTPWEEERAVPGGYLSQMPGRFQAALEKKDEAAALLLADELTETLSGNRNLLPGQARELYYRLLLLLAEQRRLSKISGGATEQTSLEQINGCANLAELDGLLRTGIQRHFELQRQGGQDTSTLYLIKEYISSNFSDEGLSIKDISEHVHLSSSYLCTIFKTQTGQTLNQYLTAYRISRAKELLRDPRNKVNEIAQEVGYADCNYFGKTFKKVVGLSPSEYREKELS